MTIFNLPRATILAAICLCGGLGLTACRTGDDPMSEEGGDDEGEVAEPCGPATDPIDESSCAPLDTDYQPLQSDADPYPACISDGGTYELVADPPGSIARIQALDAIADLLWRNGGPTRDDFAEARTTYDAEQGLGSRVERREDLHYPPIPEAEWDPALDPDKQCANSDLAAAYPDRCAGPAKLQPLINEAFIAGMTGEGDPNVNAARIKAGLTWFSYISVYKESFTCTHTAKDCDSSWAYYAGGAQVDGAIIGFAQMVEEHSQSTHQRIFDGILAVRCFRDLYSVDDYPTYDDLPPDGQQLFDDAWEQLDNALHRGLAVVLRQHALAHDDEQCSAALEANWEYVQIIGDVLDREASERDADAASELRDLYALDAPATEDVERIAELLDQVFPCP